MGQGYSLTTLSAGSAGIDVPELSDLTYETALGNARFMKTIRARHRDGLVIAKVVMKPYASMKFDTYIREILRERVILKNIPNTLSYHKAFETSSNGYLVRQYMYSSLYDRFSTRPFLEDIEKRWLAFQLLCAVRDCHANNVYHGDIKAENTLVTSWGWLFLSDFSSAFKPTYLPEDNPADFSFFFDISGRRTCYLAPERFLSPGETAEGKGGVTWAMDIFSVGCVIAELFLEGPIFNLSQLFRHRKGELNLETTSLSRIEDAEIRDMVTHMIQVEPEARYSADEYLNFWRHRAFPEYFYSFLHQYMQVITDPTSGRSPITAGKDNLGESDERIDRVFFDYDKISFLLGHSDASNPAERQNQTLTGKSLYDPFPLHLDLPNKGLIADSLNHPDVDDGTVLFLNIVTASLRSTARSTSKIRGCELLLAFAQHLTDESRMDRILPFLADMLNDSVDIVKVAALRAMTQLLATIKTASPTNANLFRQYVLPRLEAFRQAFPATEPEGESSGKSSTGHPDNSVKIALASCIATLAETAAHFLDIIQALKSDGLLPQSEYDNEAGPFHYPYEDLFDPVRNDLIKFFEAHTKTFLTEQEPEVRKAFLGSVSSLCVFFGSAKANDVILSHLNTYLNEEDWRLRAAFFDAVAGVAIYIGATNFEEFILPVMIQSLTDPEESVVIKVLRSMATVFQLGLVHRSTTWFIIDIVSRLTIHPNIWIREGAANLISSALRNASPADIMCFAVPLIKPYLQNSLVQFAELDLLGNLKPPLPRQVFEATCMWARRDDDTGAFWKPAKRNMTTKDERIPYLSSKDLSANSLSRASKTSDDLQWITRLRAAGMTSEDEFKIVALRDYIWRMVKKRVEPAADTNDLRLKEVISLKDLGVQAELVLFDHEKDDSGDFRTVSEDASDTAREPQTIADALLDASTNFAPRPSSLPQDHSQHARDPLVRANTDIGRLPLQQKQSASRPDSSDSRQQRFDNTRSKAINLMHRDPSLSKATAATGTTSANAAGRIDGNTRTSGFRSPIARAQESKKRRPNEILFKNAHTYEGRDPSILKLLDTLYLDSYPLDSVEFGPAVIPIDRRQWENRPTSSRWKPDGTLLAMLGEHTAAVTQIAVSPDHTFFITGSHDGTVRIWDTGRLERNLAHSSRQVYRHAPGAKVTHLSFITNTHCFVSTATDGTVHIVKVDCSETSSGSLRYGKLRVMREYQLFSPQTEDACYAVWAEYYKNEAQPILLLATNNCFVHALDLRTMEIIYTLRNPRSHGALTTFCTDRSKHWLLLGTQSGVLDFWDLRFRLRVRSWTFPAGVPINRLSPHPVKTRSAKLALVAGGTGPGEVSVWDVEKGIVREVYRATTAQPVDTKNATPYSALNPDSDEPRSESLRRHPVQQTATSTATAGSVSDWTVRALAVGARLAEPGRDSRHGYFVAGGGSDRKVRFWDMDRVESSCVVSGLDAGEAQPTYRASMVGGQGDTTLVEERLSGKTPAAAAAGATGGGGGGGAVDTTAGGKVANVGKKRDGTPAAAAPPGSSSSRTPRSTVISLQQQALLKSHLDTVTDVAVIEYPFSMVVSADRSGMVYVFS